MELVPENADLARQLTRRRLRRPNLLNASVRTVPLPVRIEEREDRFVLVDAAGRTIGSIPSPGGAPRLGKNEGTLFLWRES